jgi:hypothetical protein
MKSSLRDSALAGQDGVEGLVGLGKDAKNIVHLTDEERRPLVRSHVSSKSHGQLVSWSPHATRRRRSARPGYGLDSPSGPSYNAQALQPRGCVPLWS